LGPDVLLNTLNLTHQVTSDGTDIAPICDALQQQ